MDKNVSIKLKLSCYIALLYSLKTLLGQDFVTQDLPVKKCYWVLTLLYDWKKCKTLIFSLDVEKLYN